MTDARKSLRAIFDEASERSGEQRRAYLDQACGDNATLRAEVEDLLRSGEAAGGFLADPKRDATAATVPITEREGDRIGRYKLLQKIGEGGCGVVYMAEQTEPVKRRVALKVIKLGLETHPVIARFEAERQALAMMDHPNIAKILDAGTTETGRPYFVMELVRGIKITDYCEQNKLATRQRLDLFIKVCQAVQHAHQKGIIHRDLKPSNVLVTSDDGVPLPKVIDFGIAKATSDIQLTDKTLFTRFDMFIGTPAYMSPEQAEFNASDIDTRTDIYALGFLLYELLTGQTPFDSKELLNGGLDAMRKIIREKEPLRPSTRLSQMLVAAEVTRRTAGGVESSASSRRQLQENVHQLQGDLDWIVLKALEKDRTRRYDTANGLAADIQRHLANEPVTARPPSTAYKIQKAWQRNKLAFSAAAIVALALIVGISVSTWQAVVATRARSAAQQAQALAVANEKEARAQQERADREAASARRTAYIANLGSIQSDWDKRNYARVRETLASQKDYPEPSFEWFYWQRMTHLELSSFSTYAGGIKSFRLSPDRTKAVLVMGDNSIEVRLIPSGEKVTTFLGHGTMTPRKFNDADLAESAVFSPDGRFVASGGGLYFDGVVKLWNAQTGKEIRSFGNYTPGGDEEDAALPKQHVGNRQNRIAFSPDGRLVASAGMEQRYGVQVWEVATGKKLRTLESGINEKGGKWISQLAFSGDSRRIVSVGGQMRMHDIETGKVFGPVDNGATAFALSPDSRRLAVNRGKSVSVYDLTEEGFSTVPMDIPLETTSGHLSFSPDGQRLLVQGKGDTVILDSFTGERQLTLRGGSFWSEFLADSQRVASTDGDRRVKIWDASTDRELLRVVTGYNPKAMAKDGSRLVVHLPWDETRGIESGKIDGNSGGLGVLDLNTGKLISTMREHESRRVDGAAFSPDNKWVVSGGRDAGHNFRVWDAQTGEVKWTEPTPRVEHYSIGFGPKGDTVISTLKEPNQRHAIWDIATRRLTMSPRSQIGGYNWAMSADGRRLATGGYDGTVRVWDTATGEELTNWVASAKRDEAFFPVVNECMDYSADGRHLVTGDYDGFVKVWDPETGRLVHSMKGYSGTVIGVHFTPDQRRLISQGWEGAGRDGVVRLWDAATGKELLTLTDPLFKEVYTWYGTVSPDGRRLFSAPSGKKEMIIWEGAKPEEVAAWRREEEADVALWAAEQPKVEARRLARLSGATRN